MQSRRFRKFLPVCYFHQRVKGTNFGPIEADHQAAFLPTPTTVEQPTQQCLHGIADMHAAVAGETQIPLDGVFGGPPDALPPTSSQAPLTKRAAACWPTLRRSSGEKQPSSDTLTRTILMATQTESPIVSIWLFLRTNHTPATHSRTSVAFMAVPSAIPG